MRCVHVGFLVMKTADKQDFHYVLLRSVLDPEYFVALPGGGRVAIDLKKARQQKVALQVHTELSPSAKNTLLEIWNAA